ncbi:hypothetical protein GIB67_004310 [Kingdonia uniflora]|uniref:Uncharacterized protein n=1 Tax=Kingdonia uniflora TaxID=39325 RepID=A0A7J7MRG8_9MAGN|nr:hypothetical protein GIB67_004310 [Kingdonia uniflora]
MSDEGEKMMISGDDVVEERSRTKRGDVEREEKIGVKETSSPTCKHKVGRGLCKSLSLRNDEFCRKHSMKKPKSNRNGGDEKPQLHLENSKQIEDKEKTIHKGCSEESLLQLENGEEEEEEEEDIETEIVESEGEKEENEVVMEENGVKGKKIAREGLDQSLILIDSKRRTRAVNARYKDSDFPEFQLGKRMRVSNSFVSGAKVSKPRKEVSDKQSPLEIKPNLFCALFLYLRYPKLSHDEIAILCPVCCGLCNCKNCLRKHGNLTHAVNSEMKIERGVKENYCKYMIHLLYPILKKLDDDQMLEKETEARIRGIQVSNFGVQYSGCAIDERSYCNFCETSIVDYYRGCSNCLYELCLTCCKEIRSGCPQGGLEEIKVEYIDRGAEYLHGGIPPSPAARCESSKSRENIGSHVEANSENCAGPVSMWDVKENGSIPCPPKSMGGCGCGTLQLRSMLRDGTVSDLAMEAKVIAESYSPPKDLTQGCSCFNSVGKI